MGDVKLGARRFPSFEETIRHVAVPEEIDSVRATIARHVDAMDVRVGAADSVTLDDPLPELSLDLAADEASPRVLERQGPPPDYRIVELLGQGGMGQVHLAEQRSLTREVAIKTVHPGASVAAEVALCQEARITGQVEHPSVIPVHALGRSLDGRPVMIMKRVEGVSWKALLDDPSHPLLGALGRGLEAHLQILVQVSQAIAFAHGRGIVHRDLKPENVMVGRFGEVFVVDWGLAVRTGAGAEGPPHRIVGTPAYMAPEMVAGAPVDERTDVYLLGGILHEILTGDPPHGGETLMMVLAAAYTSAPKTLGPEVPAELARLCRDALARDPAHRPASASAFRDALAHYLRCRPSIALTRQAMARLASLEAYDRARAEDRPVLRRALVECRFAFQQALVEWPDNAAARGGLERALAEAVRLELAERHAGAARIALEELAEPDPALAAELASLEARIAEEEAEAARLRRLERDMDATVGAGARKRAALGIAGLGAVVTVLVGQRVETGTMTPVDLMRAGVFMALATAAILVAGRRYLLRNAFSRKIAYLALFSSFAMFTHRALGAWIGLPLHVILATDSLIFSIMLVVAGITLSGYIAYGALFTFAGTLATLAFPRWAPLVFSASTLSMLFTAAFLLRVDRGGPGRAGGRSSDE
jgi:serine/threonine-protein kinase